MIDVMTIDFSELDRPEILHTLFYPRPDLSPTIYAGNPQDLMIPVQDGHRIGARMHAADKGKPTILFFHGNGEIVSDYDDMGGLYSGLGINFLPVDYRGYGHSTGVPTVTAMMRDCHFALDYARSFLKDAGYAGKLLVMGRSMGSASALELAAHYPDAIAGLIVESGFASMEALYERLGISASIPPDKKNGLSNVSKISGFRKPTLIIHAEHDRIIPFAAGQELYEASGAPDKSLLRVPGADHNDIFYKGQDAYLNAIVDLITRV